MRRSLLILAVLCLPRLAAAEAPGPVMQLVSLLGQAHLDGPPVEAGGAGVPAGKNLTLAPGAVAQLLLGSVALSMAGPGRLRLEDPRLAVLDFQGPGTLRVAGGPAVVRIGKAQVSLRSGSIALVHRGCVYVAEGHGAALSARRKASPYRLHEGQREQLGKACPAAWLSGGTEIKLRRQLDRFQPPAAWAPPVAEVKLEDIQQAEGSMQRERQAQRETAACGCTEGGGAGDGVGDGKGGSTTTPETFSTPVLVKVRGVPKGVSK